MHYKNCLNDELSGSDLILTTTNHFNNCKKTGIVIK